jgi:hypothetical protein
MANFYIFFIYWAAVDPSPLILGPLAGLLHQTRIMIVEQSVECLAGETEVLGENLPQFRSRRLTA